MLITVLMPVFCAIPGRAQSPFDMQTRHQSLLVEWEKPVFDASSNLGLFTSVINLAGRIDLRPGVMLILDWPYAVERTRNEMPRPSSTGSGNPLIALNVQLDPSLSVTFGLRVPVASASQHAVFTGLFTDYGRMEAFLPDMFSSFLLAHFYHLDFIELYLGPSFRANVDRRSGEQPDIDLLYGLGIGYGIKRLRFKAQWTGRSRWQSRFAPWKDTVDQLTLFMVVRFHQWSPGFFFRKPIQDEWNRILPSAVGLHLVRII
jgi:hypothetical protein